MRNQTDVVTVQFANFIDLQSLSSYSGQKIAAVFHFYNPGARPGFRKNVVFLGNGNYRYPVKKVKQNILEFCQQFKVRRNFVWQKESIQDRLCVLPASTY